MRAVGLTDLDAAARAVMAVPEGQRADFVQHMLHDAHMADCFRKALGRPHPAGGTGSLYAQAVLSPRQPARLCDQAYCDALQAVLKGLTAWRNRPH